jgi:hypothetical protein
MLFEYSEEDCKKNCDPMKCGKSNKEEIQDILQVSDIVEFIKSCRLS